VTCADPTPSAEVASVADPETSVAVPIAEPLVKNVTVPVGAELPLACLTVATSVTAVLSMMLDAEERNTVVVFTAAAESAFTVTATMLEDEALNDTPPE
jgi:hypothetical protein